MSNKISFQDFRHNTLSMINMLSKAHTDFPAGPEREKAYAHVGAMLGLGADAFTDLE